MALRGPDRRHVGVRPRQDIHPTAAPRLHARFSGVEVDVVGFNHHSSHGAYGHRDL